MPEEVEIDLEEKEEIKIGDKDKGGSAEPPVDSPRWKEIYWAAKEGERAREELKSLRSEREKEKGLVEEMRKWNENLMALIDEKATSNEEKSRESRISDLDGKIATLIDQKRQAREQANFDAEIKIDEEIADLRFEKRKLKETKSTAVGKEPPKPKDESLSDEDDEAVTDWIEENKWFNTNPKLRREAIKLEKAIRKEDDFTYATTPEILDEVAVRMKDKIAESGKRTPSLVESGERQGAPPSKVKLSGIEMELVKGLGISPEDFAKQKLVIAKMRGDKKAL